MRGFFSYLDYRALIRERFADLKRSRRGVTHRSLSQIAGFASPNFLKLVMDGKRNLTPKSLPKVCRAFEITGKEAKFFSHLVAFNQAKDVAAKESAYDKMKALRRDLPLMRVEHSQFEYFDHWYTVAIRELVGLKDFQEDAEWIRSRLKGKVSLPQVRHSLRLLERLDFLRRDPQGRLVPTEATLTTGDEVAGLGIYRYHQGMMQNAGEALQKTDPDHRDISSITVSVDKKNFNAIKRRIQEFRKEVMAMAGQTPEADAVYQMNVQLFPLSEILWRS